MNQQKKFSEALRDWRKKKNLSQQEVAQRIGISRTIISFLENGQQQPQVHHIKLFQDNFGIDFSETITGSAELDRPYYGSPKDGELTASALATLINQQHEVKKDLVIARSLLQEIITIGDEIDRDLFRRIKIIYSICDQALMKL
jgi:transcriptional regulator with XRE-family HTH domain